MVDSHLVQDGSVQVSNVDGISDDVVAKVIRFAVNDATFDTRSG